MESQEVAAIRKRVFSVYSGNPDEDSGLNKYQDIIDRQEAEINLLKQRLQVGTGSRIAGCSKGHSNDTIAFFDWLQEIQEGQLPFIATDLSGPSAAMEDKGNI